MAKKGSFSKTIIKFREIIKAKKEKKEEKEENDEEK